MFCLETIVALNKKASELSEAGKPTKNALSEMKISILKKHFKEKKLV